MNTKNIQVTAPVRPDLELLSRLNKEVIVSGHYTNFGPKINELETKLCNFLHIPALRVVNNGTMALQVLLSMYAKRGRRYVITTPFTFAATASSIVMAGYEPYFVDINPETLNLDIEKVSEVMERIGDDVAAILPVHVFGNPCSPIEFERLAKAYEVPLLFDACHTFGALYRGRALSSYGDASAMSFHPTKIFHCGEGGGVVLQNENEYKKAREHINFGFTYTGDIRVVAGNAKISEFNVAIGLAVIDKVPDELTRRAELAAIYSGSLKGSDKVEFQQTPSDYVHNNQYYAVMFSPEDREKVIASLNERGVYPRCYFSPSLSITPAFSRYCHEKSVESEKIATRILCLPLYGDLTNEDAEMIAQTIIEAIE